MGNGNSQQPRSNLRFELPAGGPWGGKRISQPTPQQPVLTPGRWGERIGQPPGTTNTMDFIDSNNDGSDDRYQRPPWQQQRGTMDQFIGGRIDPRQHDQFRSMPLEEQERYRTGMQRPSAGYQQQLPPWSQGPHQQLAQESRLASQLENLGVGTAGLNSLFASDTSVSSTPPPFQQKPGFLPWYQNELNRQQQEEDAYMQSRQMHAEARNRAMSPGGTMPRNMPRFNQAVENAGLAGINRSDWSDAQRQDFRAARRAIPRGANGGLVSQMRNRNPLPASRWSLPHYRNLV